MPDPALESLRSYQLGETANPAEVATLIVRGRKFTDWESVWVQHRWAEDAPIFRFTAAERDPIPNVWWKLQFKPDDECAIYLGANLAIVGYITTRQVAYDANSHGVMLMGRGSTWYAARGAVMNEPLTFDKKTFEQVANEVLAPYRIKPKVIGVLNAKPFERLRADPGVTVWSFLETIARTKGVVLGSDHRGNFLLIGQHEMETDSSLVEGRNILKAQITIDKQKARSDYYVDSQPPQTDGHSGVRQNQQRGRASGSSPMYSPLRLVSEFPAWDLGDIQQRAQYEAQWNEGYNITANITVQGWHQPSGALWQAGGHYWVRSPMGMMDQVLKAETVTFEQDRNSGTTTTLELVAPWKLNGKADYNLLLPDAAGKIHIDLGPPETGPAVTQQNTSTTQFPETLR